jgi:endonuclease/exonuclease/phosphatase family metal-dependent hydrolase
MRVKVVSLNVWHGGRLWDGLVDFLTDEDPDILLIQEAYDSHDPDLDNRFRTMDEFAMRLGFAHQDFAPTFGHAIDEGTIPQGNAVFSKFPIIARHDPRFFVEPYNPSIEEKRENFPHMPRNLQHVTLSVNGLPLNIFNLQGVWDLDGTNNSPERLKMSQVIVDAVQDLPNVVLAGDTNALRASQAIRNIEQYLSNVFGDELATSFNTKRKDLEKYPGYATATVDMMFVSPNLKVVEHYCPQVDVSDHLPLVIRIEI